MITLNKVLEGRSDTFLLYIWVVMHRKPSSTYSTIETSIGQPLDEVHPVYGVVESDLLR